MIGFFKDKGETEPLVALKRLSVSSVNEVMANFTRFT
jgi:hypothetical protein